MLKYQHTHTDMESKSNLSNTHGSPNWTLVVLVLWSVVGSLSGESRHICHISPGKDLSQ